MIGEFFVLRRQIEKEIANAFNNENDRILDIGSGSNPNYQGIMKGNIINFDMKKTGKNHVVGNADFLPFKKKSFDKIIVVNSLYYFKNPFKVIESINNILKPNGRLVIVNPFFYPIHDIPDDKYRFTEYGLKTMLQDYFKIEKIKEIGGFFSIPAVMLHSLIKGLPLLVPKSIKWLVQLMAYIVFYIPYIIAQLINILDIFDRTKRWPTYYVVVAKKIN